MSIIQKHEIKNLWEEQLNEIFEKEKHTDMELFLNIIALMLHDRFDEQISKLYSTVSNVELFTKIINTFSGMTLQIPEREEFKETLSIALSYYYKKIKDMSWDDIKKELPFDDITTIKAGKGIAKLDKTIKERLNTLLEKQGY